MRFHPFDRALAVRASLAIIVAFLVALSIVVATDEATSTRAMRAARLSALGPLVAALGVLGVVAHARSRGELRALEAVGIPPWRAARGAALAGLVAGALSVALLVSPLADAESLFPAVHVVVRWVFDDAGTLARAPGVTVFADGRLALTGGVASSVHAVPTAWAALPCIAPIAALVPGWAVTPLSPFARALSLGASAVIAVFALHGIAAGRLAAIHGITASIPLVVATLIGRSDAFATRRTRR
jgi:hypothetical protein